MIVDNKYESNTSKNKRVAKNTFVLYVRMFFILAISLYTSRVILASLGVVDYGLYNVIGGIIAMFSFVSAAMGNSTQRFVVYALGKGDTFLLKSTISSCVLIHFVIGVVIVLLGETIGLWYLHTKMVIPCDRLQAAEWVYQFTIISSFVAVINVPFNAIIIAYEKMAAFAYISVMDCLLKLGVAVSLCYFSTDRLILYGALILGIQLLNRIIYQVYCYRKLPESRVQLIYNKHLFNKMFNFAGWSLIGNIAWIGYTQGLNLLLNLFFGPAVNAARGIAVQVQSAVMSFTLNFQTAINPQITKAYASGDSNRFNTLIFASSRYCFYLMLLVIIPILIETPYLLSLWLKEVPEYTTAFVRLVLIILLIEPLRNPINQAVQSTGEIKTYQICEGSILLLIVPVSYIALKLGGSPDIVFYIQLVFFILAHFVRLLVCKKLIRLNLNSYFHDVVVNPLGVALISLSLPLLSFMIMDVHLCSFIVVVLISFISTIGVIYFYGLKLDEKIFVRDKIKTFLNKIIK